MAATPADQTHPATTTHAVFAIHHRDGLPDIVLHVRPEARAPAPPPHPETLS